MIARENEHARILNMMRWSFPHWRPGGWDIVNVRKTGSPYWRVALDDTVGRCQVPFDHFQEWTVEQHRLTSEKRSHFLLIPSRPIGTSAGVRHPTDSGPRYVLLTTGYGGDPGAASAYVVGAVHPKAVPVILDAPPAVDRWLNTPIEDALTLVTAYPSQLMVVD